MSPEDIDKVLQQLEALREKRELFRQMLTELHFQLNALEREYQQKREVLPVEVRMDLVCQGK